MNKIAALLTLCSNKGFIRVILLLAPIATAIIAIVNFGKFWDEWNIPRPLFTTEYKNYRSEDRQNLQHIHDMIIGLEVEFRERNIKSDSKALRDLEKEITNLLSKQIAIPDTLLEVKNYLEDNIEENKRKLRLLEKNQE